jgi:hypothetical protein
MSNSLHGTRCFGRASKNFEPISDGLAKRLAPRQSSIKAKRFSVLSVLSNHSPASVRDDEREAAVHIMQAHTPVRTLISRPTRELLRQYYKAGRFDSHC